MVITSLLLTPFSYWIAKIVYWIYFQISSSYLRPFWISGWFLKFKLCFIFAKVVVSSFILIWFQSFYEIYLLFYGILPLKEYINSGKHIEPVPSLSNKSKMLWLYVVVISILCYLITLLNFSADSNVSWSVSAFFSAFSKIKNPFVPLEANLFFILVITD